MTKGISGTMKYIVSMAAVLAVWIGIGINAAGAGTASCSDTISRVAAILHINQSAHADAGVTAFCAAKRDDRRAAGMAYLTHLAAHHGNAQETNNAASRDDCTDRLWTVAEMLNIPDRFYKLGAVVKRCIGAGDRPVQAAALMVAKYSQQTW